jgi:hypothetical protein
MKLRDVTTAAPAAAHGSPMSIPSLINDAGGTNWPDHYSSLMQYLMMNNASARCYDVMGRLIRPEQNYHPHIRGWWESFK